jgi:hypothetical protein
MSDETTEPTPAQGEAEQQTAEPTAPEVDWKAKAREWERRAKDNKSAADELAALKEAQKSEAQKLAERLADAEAKAHAAEMKALRADIAQAKGVPASLLAGSTEEELNASADALLAFRGESVTPRAPKPDPNQGRGGALNVSTEQLFAAFMNEQL